LISRYSAQQITRDNVPVVRLADAQADLTATIVPSHGNIAFELLHGGKNWLYSPYDSPAQMAGQPGLFGVPLLAPWANRLSSDTYTVNGAEYVLNRRLGNIRGDSNHLAIHGLVMFAPWTVREVKATDDGAQATSILSFTKNPRWMAQFPFAHHLEMTHRLTGGRLEVHLSITNESTEYMPISIGFHPYFTLPDSHRDDWKISLPVHRHLKLSALNIPVGESEPVQAANLTPLRGQSFDDVYTDLDRDGSGYAVFQVADSKQSLRVRFGSKYQVGVVYAPPGKDFICFEPMAAPTDALHLAPAGKYAGLQQVRPDETWTEEFWIEPLA
jgi:aldose 1-epimerase